MSKHSLSMSDELHRYLCEVAVDEHPVMRALREETARMPQGIMQIAPEQAQFMMTLVRLMAVRRALEIGVFTGYSALAVALAMPDDGRLLACDINVGWTDIARRHWERAGVGSKIELRLGPALDTLRDLTRDPACVPFDLVFIDADKTNYWNYFDIALKLLRPRGVILVDNVLWSGKVIDDHCVDADTLTIRAFNLRVKADPRVHFALLPVADGLTVAVKK